MARLVTLHDANGEVIYPQSVWDENMIPDNTVTSSMIDWSTFGNQSSYVDLGTIRICFGSATVEGIPTSAYGEKAYGISFPVPFASAPMMFAQARDMSGNCGEYVSPSNISTTIATLWCGHTGTTTSTAMHVSWLAIGAKA